ncbi:MAG: polymer-forming cytoskeletal protein [Pseudomonadota bacterium]
MKIATAWNANEAQAATAAGAESIVRRNLRIEGTLRFTGSLTIEGEIQGSIISEPASVSRLTLTESGVIEGSVDVASALISGHVKGNVHSSQHLTLTAKAVIRGDVKYRELEIAQGAVVDGQLIFEGESRGA